MKTQDGPGIWACVYQLPTADSDVDSGFEKAIQRGAMSLYEMRTMGLPKKSGAAPFSVLTVVVLNSQLIKRC
jgi:hypothetical protein